MPIDPVCNFDNWVTTPTQIKFPNGRSVMEWNETTDWLSIGGDRYILIRERHAIIGKIDEPSPPLLDTDLYHTIPAKTLVRAWLLADSFLVSPEPDYNQAQYLAQFPMKSARYYDVLPCLLGTWVTRVCVDPTGMYFAVYDSGMNQLKAWRCGSYPSRIEIECNNVVVTSAYRWTEKESKVVIAINNS